LVFNIKGRTYVENKVLRIIFGLAETKISNRRMEKTA
jgi:hypothetical protein